MSKITFSLVGGQPFPVYAQALDSKPDILVLFYSKQTERYALNVERCLKQKLPHLVVQQVETDANDLKKSYRTFAANANVWLKPENEITVNLSGGAKPWSMQLLNIFGDKENAKCVFIDQNNRIWDMTTLTSHTFAHTEISLDDKFALYGVEATSRESLENYTEDDLRAIADIERLYRFDSKAFNDITSQIEQDDRSGIKTGVYYSKNRACFIERQDENTFECRFAKVNSPITDSATISSPHASRLLISTGWFEVKVAQLLSKWYGASKVWLNTVIRYSSISDPVNEIDIMVETTNDKLLFVECKTQVYASTDIDKFNDVIKSYGGLGSKRVFITYWPMKALAKGKCEALIIPQFSTSEVLKDDFTKRQFYEALDMYLDTINAR